RDRPAEGAHPHLSGPPLPEWRAPHPRERADDARKSLRLRGERPPHPREPPHDGRPRTPMRRGPGPRGEGATESSMSTMTTTDLEAAVEDAAAYLYVWALKDIPQDLRDALADAATKETSVPGQRVLQTILKNVQIADTDKNLVCQDTGIAVYTCRV